MLDNIFSNTILYSVQVKKWKSGSIALVYSTISYKAIKCLYNNISVLHSIYEYIATTLQYTYVLCVNEYVRTLNESNRPSQTRQIIHIYSEYCVCKHCGCVYWNICFWISFFILFIHLVLLILFCSGFFFHAFPCDFICEYKIHLRMNAMQKDLCHSANQPASRTWSMCMNLYVSHNIFIRILFFTTRIFPFLWRRINRSKCAHLENENENWHSRYTIYLIEMIMFSFSHSIFQ